MKTKLIPLFAVAVLGCSIPAFADEAGRVAAKVEANVAEVKGDAAKMALKELDAEIEAVDDMIDQAPNEAEKAAAKARLETLKERRSELRKTYVKSRYDELKADVRAEANRVGAWSKRTFTRDPAEKAADDIQDATRDAKRDAKRAGENAREGMQHATDSAYAHAASAGAALDLTAYKMRPTDTNKDEARAALKALDQKIEALEERVDQMPRGANRDAAQRRIKALKERKDELRREFNKARFNALVDDVQAEWNDFRH